METLRLYIEKARRKVQGGPQLFCSSCIEQFTAKKILNAPCGHQYCPSCLRQMASVSLDSVEMFPVKCCRKEIPVPVVVSAMNYRNKKRYVSQSEEQAVPPTERIYCPRASCGKWIHPDNKGSRPGTKFCSNCRAKVCCACRGFAHGPWPCAEDESLIAVLRMAKARKWQRCNRCHFMVEKLDGCNHIACRCGHHFCYICGGRQNRCRCPTEDTEEPAPDGDLEARTLVTAMQQTNLDGAH